MVPFNDILPAIRQLNHINWINLLSATKSCRISVDNVRVDF